MFKQRNISIMCVQFRDIDKGKKNTIIFQNLENPNP